MGAAALVMLREGLEASLIVGILLGYLVKLRQAQHRRYIWLGVGLAVVASAVVAAAFARLAGGFEGAGEAIFEGIVMLIAVGVLSSMILWMQQQARHIRSRLEQQVDRALSSGQLWGLASLAFVAVFREGVESVLFLGAVFFVDPSPSAAAGALLGLGASILAAYLMFRAAVSLDLRRFFFYTGLLLILLAAGLLAGGVHELQEAGLLPGMTAAVWDTNRWIDEKGPVGSFLKALFGYNGNPSLLEVLAWLGYMGTIGVRYLGATRPRRRPEPVSTAA